MELRAGLSIVAIAAGASGALGAEAPSQLVAPSFGTGAQQTLANTPVVPVGLTSQEQ